MQKFKKLMCILLVAASLMSFSVACGNKPNEAPIPVIVPEKQLMTDKYESNEEINEFITYAIDYFTQGRTMKIATLFNHTQIQIDSWDTISLGLDTMGEIVDNIDAANKKYIEQQTAAIIAQRQAIIDEEYNKAKAEAEKKGKTYTQEKKKVRTDDIHFDAPYTYCLYRDTNHKTALLYEPTRLLDPSKGKTLHVVVSKYGIPYVQLEFVGVSYLYNAEITQESDWVINGVRAANVQSYVSTNADGSTNTPEFVDVDGLNKAAKNNIRMSGDIRFSGEGFTWESLLLLCDALELEERKGAYHSFSKSSDKNFTYYTILITTNPFERKELSMNGDSLVAPITKLVATFDPLTQVCLNWTIDMYSQSRNFGVAIHDPRDTVSVNVQEYQVDTNNYETLRQNQKKWIKDNASNLVSAYCAIDENDKMIGIIRTGMVNIDIEIDIDGELYNCRSYKKISDTEGYGYYIKASDEEKMYELEEKDRDKFLEEHTIKIAVKYRITDGHQVVASFNANKDIRFLSSADQKYYYIADIDTENDSESALFLSEADAEEFITFLAKSYQLSESTYEELRTIMYNKGIVAVRNHIDEMFAEAEREQAESDIIKGHNKNLLSGRAKVNYKEALNEIKIDGQKMKLEDMSINSVRALGYEESYVYKDKNAAIIINGKLYTNKELGSIGIEEKNGKIMVLVTENEKIYFANDVHVGMTVDDLLSKFDKDKKALVNNNFLILKNETTTMVVEVNLWTNVVKSVALLNNSQFVSAESSKDPESGDKDNDDQKPQTVITNVDKSLQEMKVNTNLYLGNLIVNGHGMNIFSMKKDEMSSLSFAISNHITVIDKALYKFAGVAITTENMDNSLFVEFNEDKGANAICITGSECAVTDLQLKVGMSRKDLKKALSSETKADLSKDTIVLKSEHNILIIEMVKDKIDSICVFAGTVSSN